MHGRSLRQAYRCGGTDLELVGGVRRLEVSRRRHSCQQRSNRLLTEVPFDEGIQENNGGERCVSRRIAIAAQLLRLWGGKVTYRSVGAGAKSFPAGRWPLQPKGFGSISSKSCNLLELFARSCAQAPYK